MRLMKELAFRGAALLLRLDTRIAKSGGRFIFCYHRIMSSAQARREWVHDSMWVSPETFEEQIRWMQTVGEVVDLDDILDFESRRDRTLFAVTFDDGWRDNLINALPVMQRHDVRATIFIATSCMDNGTLMWPEDLATKTATLAASGAKDLDVAIAQLAPTKLPRANLRRQLEVAIEQLKYLSEANRSARIEQYYVRLGLSAAPSEGYMLNWSEARDLIEAGMRIESHTHRHIIFSEATPEAVQRELEESRERIRRNLGIETVVFAFPNARYRGTEGPMLDRVGYKYAFRMQNLPLNRETDPHFIPRFIVSESQWPERVKLRLIGLR